MVFAYPTTVMAYSGSQPGFPLGPTAPMPPARMQMPFAYGAPPRARQGGRGPKPGGGKPLRGSGGGGGGPPAQGGVSKAQRKKQGKARKQAGAHDSLHPSLAQLQKENRARTRRHFRGTASRRNARWRCNAGRPTPPLRLWLPPSPSGLPPVAHSPWSPCLCPSACSCDEGNFGKTPRPMTVPRAPEHNTSILYRTPGESDRFSHARACFAAVLRHNA